MGVRTDHGKARKDKSVVRKDDVLDAHAFLSLFVVIFYILGSCKIAHPLTLFRGLYIFIRSKVVRDQNDFFRIEYFSKRVLFEYIDRRRRGDVVSEEQVKFRLDQVARGANLFARMLRKDLLCHCHAHIDYHPFDIALCIYVTCK